MISASEHLKNVWATISHLDTAIPRDQRGPLAVKSFASVACATLILSEVTIPMAGMAGLAALDPIYETFHMLDQDGAAWRAVHEHQPQLPF